MNVHHGRYDKWAEPWQYESESLHVLCDDCHAHRHATEKSLKESISRLGHLDLYLLSYLSRTLANFNEIGAVEDHEELRRLIFGATAKLSHIELEDSFHA
jgi:hypothetical protein